MKIRIAVLLFALILICLPALAEESTSEVHYLNDRYYFLKEGTSPTIKSTEANEGLILTYKISKEKNFSYFIEITIGSTALPVYEETIPIILSSDRYKEITQKMDSKQKKTFSLCYNTLSAYPQDYYTDFTQINSLIPNDKEIKTIRENLSYSNLNTIVSACAEIGYTEQDKINDQQVLDYDKFAQIQCSPVYYFQAPYIDRTFTTEDFIAICTFLDSIKEDCIAFYSQKPNDFFQSGTTKEIALNNQKWNMDYFELIMGNTIYMKLVPQEVDPTAHVWYCQTCGRWNENGNYCITCGTPQDEKQIICRNCGYKIGENTEAQYCPECGTKIE